MTTVTITHGDGSTDTIPYTYGWEQRREVGRMRRVKIDVPRSEAKSANLTPKVDKIDLGSTDTVRLVDVLTGGSTWSLVAYSAEWDSNRAGYTDGGDLREDTDQNLVTSFIGDVSTWTAGTVNSYTGALSFVLNHASPSEALRRIEANVPGELQWRDYGTVDYTQRLGSDRSGSITLSAADGTIEQDIQITERGRELDGTHIRVLGAHEGEAQYYANLVPAADTTAQSNLDNVVTYTTTRWSSSDDTDWDRWENKDVTDQATIEEEAAALGDELKESLVEAETVVPTSVGVTVGDTVHVEKPDADLDRDMRVHRKTRQAGNYNDAGGDAAVVDRVLLSTRTTLRKDDDRELESITRFNSGYQGSSIADTAGPFGKAVTSSTPLEFKFRYPDLAYENVAQLQITGREYRVDSVGAASGGGSTETSDSNSVYDQVVFQTGGSTSISGQTGWQVVDSFSTGTSTAWMHATITLQATRTSSGTETLQCRVRNTSTGATYENVMRLNFGNNTVPNAENSVDIIVPVDVAGESYEAAIDANSNSEYVATTIWTGVGQHTHSIALPAHTHPVEAGVFTSGDTPSSVDVAINGSTVATDVGSGTFETVVDVGGAFTNDAWNTVTLSSDSLGILEVSSYVEGYDKVGAE